MKESKNGARSIKEVKSNARYSKPVILAAISCCLALAVSYYLASGSRHKTQARADEMQAHCDSGISVARSPASHSTLGADSGDAESTTEPTGEPR